MCHVFLNLLLALGQEINDLVKFVVLLDKLVPRLDESRPSSTFVHRVHYSDFTLLVRGRSLGTHGISGGTMRNSAAKLRLDLHGWRLKQLTA